MSKNKICGKIECNNISIFRGKYCEEHRTNKKISKEENERRLLRVEQENDYEETMIIDKMKLIEEENKIINKIIIDSNMDQLRKKVYNQEIINDNSFKIKFTKRINTIKCFNNNASFSDIYDFIDIFLYDNNISIEYELISYPNIKYKRNEIKKINDYFNCKNISLIVN